MLTSSVICKVSPVGVLLGGSGIYGIVSQCAPQVSALLRSSQNGKAFPGAASAIAVTTHAEADHVD